jgi:hypothetical protein
VKGTKIKHQNHSLSGSISCVRTAPASPSTAESKIRAKLADPNVLPKETRYHVSQQKTPIVVNETSYRTKRIRQNCSNFGSYRTHKQLTGHNRQDYQRNG